METKTEKPEWTTPEKSILCEAVAALKRVRFMPPDRKPYCYGMDSVILDLENFVESGRPQ